MRNFMTSEQNAIHKIVQRNVKNIKVDVISLFLCPLIHPLKELERRWLGFVSVPTSAFNR